MLKSISLQNFRGFREHSIDFAPFCLLIGQNNAGKTTLIEALRLIGTAIRRAPTAKFKMAPQWLDGIVTGPGYTFSVETIGIDHKTIHYNYQSDDPAIIKARFSNNSLVTVCVGADTTDFFAQLALPGGKKLNSRNQITDRRFPPVSVMPPIGSLLERETRREPSYMRKHIEGYLSHRHVRNQMAAMPDAFLKFRTKLEETWDHLQVGDVEFGLGEKQDEYGITIRDGPFVSEMGVVGSGLQAWIQTLWFLSRSPTRATIVLDEPDVYLHADLQRKLIKILTEDGASQTIVATHSLEMISSVSPSEIISVTKREPRSRAITSNSQAQTIADKLGTIHNIQLSKLASAGAVLFLEGKDYAFLDQFAFKRGNAFYDRFSAIPHFSVGGASNWQKAAMAAKVISETSAGKVKCLLLLDRDYKTDEEIHAIRNEAMGSNLIIYFWQRKEIENYLVCKESITGYISGRIEGDVDQSAIYDCIEAALAELEEELVELAADSLQASDRRLSLPTAMSRAREFVAKQKSSGKTPIELISGKKALSKISEKCKDKIGVSFSTMSICRQMDAAHVPEEVNKFLDFFR